MPIDLYPNIAKEWVLEKNEQSPSKVLYGSSKKAGWKCENGHIYEAKINSRVGGTGCPFCKNKKLLKGYNDFETLNHGLIKDWNYKRNELKPDKNEL